MAEIGATLREARLRARIDINEVETRTKIRAKYLRALENEEWDLLPGDVYVRSFLRTYSDFLGLDSRQLLDDYKRQYERPPDHELRPITPRNRDREHRPRRPLLPPSVVVGLVLVAIVVALFFVGRKPGSTTSTPTATHAATNHRGHRGRSVTATQHGRTTTTAIRSRSRPGGVSLRLIPTGPVYVCLVDGRGRVLINGVTYSAGQTIPTKTASKMLLTLGNANVQMTVDGKPVRVVPSPAAIGFLLTPTSRASLPPARMPRCA